MGDHSEFSGIESSLDWGMEVAWWSLGTFSEGMGLKEAEGLFHQIIIRAVPWVPAGWGIEKKTTVWRSKSLSLYLSTQTVSLMITVYLLFIYERHRNMDLWSYDRMGSTPRHGCLHEIAAKNKTIWRMIFSDYTTYIKLYNNNNHRQLLLSFFKQYRKWNLEPAHLVHSVLVQNQQWNKQYCFACLSGAMD